MLLVLCGDWLSVQRSRKVPDVSDTLKLQTTIYFSMLSQVLCCGPIQKCTLLHLAGAWQDVGASRVGSIQRRGFKGGFNSTILRPLDKGRANRVSMPSQTRITWGLLRI